MRGKALRLLFALGVALLVASIALGLPGDGSPDEQASAPSAEAHAHDHEHASGPEPAGDVGSSGDEADGLDAHRPQHEHALADRPGDVPSRAEASELQHHFEEFVVRGDDGLDEMAARGYLEGEGTVEDPYVIDGFRVDEDLTVADTSQPLVIENSYVEGQLTLNFVGEDVYVHHNYVHDLRVNENVDRTGPTTSGLFERNEIAFIGQLRHFAGTFRHNDVGPRPDGVVDTYLSDTGPADLPENVVWNFDGYHGAHVHNNTVEGRTDVKLHGHFHGSCPGCTPHDHADEADFPDGEGNEDRSPRSRHSYRYHVLDFENNTIHADEADRALRFYDRAHAGDDQTAASEPNPYLEDRHEHHAYLRVHGNAIEGGSLVFDVVNAEDDRHRGLVQEARIDLEANEVERQLPRGVDALVPAFRVQAADHTELFADANAYTFVPEGSQAPEGYGWAVDGEPSDATGFWLRDVNASQVHVTGTEGANATYGLTLEQVRDNTPLQLVDNRFDASEEARHER